MRGDVAEAFRSAAELGCDGVELHLKHADDIDQAGLKDLMNEYGLAVPTLGTGLAAGEDELTFGDTGAGVRKNAVERVMGHVELAGEIGSAVTLGLI